MSRSIWILAFTLMALGTSEALAHTGIGVTYGFSNGWRHPLAGLDHILVMIAIGVFAANLGGRALWLLPVSFLSMMLIGAALALQGVVLPLAELGIAASVIVLGALLATQWRLAIPIAVAITAIFAIFHGYVHGGEMHTDDSGLSYAIGFLTATALLHGLGIAIAVTAVKMRWPNWMLQAAGGLMTSFGLTIFLRQMLF
jgi:urease accessory protein